MKRREEICLQSYYKILKERNHPKNLDLDGKNTVLRKQYERISTGFIWYRAETDGNLL
jgi:hypothetical protein